MREYEEFISNITEYLSEHYNIPEYKGKKIVKETPIHTLFNTHIDMVMHDGVKYWACIIFKSYNKNFFLTSFIQIISIRYFNKKIFLKSPLHHHFEMLGFKETDIIKLFYLVSLACSLITLIYILVH